MKSITILGSAVFAALFVVSLTAASQTPPVPAKSAQTGPATGAQSKTAASAKTTQPIAVDQLPPAVAQTIQTTYPHATVSKAAKVTSGSAVEYEVNVKTQKGVKATKVFLSPDGKVLSTKHKKV